MTAHQDCVGFLQWCLQRLGLHWPGYRRVHRLVCKRLNRRKAELGLGGFAEYRSWIEAHPDEWAHIDAMCRIPISRFYRDRDVFAALGATVLSAVAALAVRQERNTIRCWSAGCAAGEEPYTLVLAWHYQVAHDWPDIALRVIGTDADEMAISRAGMACYAASSLKELPESWRRTAFQPRSGLLCLKPELRDCVELRLQDVRTAMPDGPFGIILCRNLAFTYFAAAMQQQVLTGMLDRLVSGGFLVLGKHEALPEGAYGLTRLSPTLPIFRFGGLR